MRKLSGLLSILLLIAITSQSVIAQGYNFTDVKRNSATPVKNQASSGTCWSYATAAFLESELLRTGKGEFDLSEIYIVRYNYLKRMDDNYLRQGKGNLGQGSLAHMFTNGVEEFGIVPQEVYSGINYDSPVNNHKEVNKFINAISAAAVELKQRSPEYYKLINSLMDIYFGAVPQTFTYKGKSYTPVGFAKFLGLNMSDYVEITSFSHIPFYKKSVIEVPDNWDHASFYNIPLDEFISVIDNALMSGYTVCWDGDVSEKGFSHTNGVAINPNVQEIANLSTEDRARFEKMTPEERYSDIYKFQKIFPEVNVTQEIRQRGYENFTTTDDHLMLLTGIVKDQNGNKYYITKNSWGTDRNRFGGYLNMSESFVKAKSISVMVHKESIPADIRKKLGIQ
ncbi:MAG: aminopeptidase [Bacteroidetes bacterium HGW-Bacteroidetes-8]|jgi:bleomycin hydrolase|nr:MAG: aminopeptidase [Bacteroidetes bacterium HGW-Bacteroidetes-8]